MLVLAKTNFNVSVIHVLGLGGEGGRPFIMAMNAVNGKYWYKNGFSIAAIITVAIAGIISLIFIDFSWVVGLPLGFVIFIILKKLGVDGIKEANIMPSR